jgi:hypothetical protein
VDFWVGESLSPAYGPISRGFECGLDVCFRQSDHPCLAVGFDEIYLVNRACIIVEIELLELLSVYGFHDIKWAVIQRLHFVAIICRKTAALDIVKEAKCYPFGDCMGLMAIHDDQSGI